MTSPIKLTFKSEAFCWLMIIIAIALSFYFYAHWPNMVVSHWNFQGQPDGYSSKTFNAVFFPLLLLGMYLMFILLPLLDPKKERYGEFEKVYHIFKTLILSCLFIIYLAAGFYNLGYAINIGIIIPLIIGLLMIIMGNYMGKLKKNWFMGIRTPWTLSSDNVWNKTHRVGGWMFIVFGLCIITSPMLSPDWGLAIFIGGAILAVVGTFAYSYIAYLQENKK